MQNGEWDPNVLTILKPQGDYLLVAPASNATPPLGYAGWQWISKAAIGGLQAAAQEFRASQNKALYVREAFRSLDTQKYYIKHPPVAGAVVAQLDKNGNGTSIHGLGDAVDVWSGINTSFTSPEHLAFKAIGLKYGWHAVGENFGEPWHFQFQAGTATASAGGTTVITTTPEEDMPLNAADAKLINDTVWPVVVGVLRAPEFANKLEAAVESATISKIEAIYRTDLGRDVDYDSLVSWLNFVTTGQGDIAGVRAQIRASAEYKSKH